jgi:hypothetical protein
MSSKQDEGARRRVERRSDPRLATRLISAIVEDPEHGALVFTADAFSRTGAFLRRLDKLTPLPKVGDIIKLVLRWPVETRMHPVHVDAKVVRLTEYGVGVQFEIKA